ncbi:MAG: aldo/keto reductase [Candidatus Cloacimonetes bacterium]|nr:aldo/keto reductase [Candidatus Cloacimonadota bacterium]
MKYRSHPRIDFQPSALGFGCMRLPVIDRDQSRIDDELAIPMVRHAIDQGVNYLDTAWPYHNGTSEAFVSRVVKDGYREKVKIADKYPTWEKIESLADADRIFDEQLKRLDDDHIDFYMLHALCWPFWQKVKQFDLIDWIARKKQDGLVSHVGFSFHDQLPLFKEILDAHDWDFCQIQYNYMDIGYQAGREGLRYAHGKGIPVIVMEPLRGGDLVRNIPSDVQAVFDGAPVKRSLAEWALRWLWDQEEVWMALSGMSAMSEAVENVSLAASCETGGMSDKEKSIIARARELYLARGPVGCTGCRYCMPCPQGVDIQRLLGLLNEWRMFENRGKLRFFLGTVSGDARPDKCNACGECLEKCPQHLDIPALMRELVELYELLKVPEPQ